jgi:D-galactarolactone cycloisomerase
MIIRDADVLQVQYAMKRPAGPAGVMNSRRESLLVKLVGDDGSVGWGETYSLPGARDTLNGLASSIIGRDLLRGPLSLDAFPFDEPSSAPAIGAVDMAVHDLVGKALGVPVHRLLGGKRRERVLVYASGFLYQQDVPPATVWFEEAERALSQGFHAMKIRIGGLPPAEELPLLERLRNELPDHVYLMADAWGAYSIREALQVGHVLEQLGFVWFEEPCAPLHGYGGYERLATALEIPIAGGESVRSTFEIKELLDRRVLGVLQPDIAICGGMRTALFAAELAALHGVECCPHSWNGPIMEAATLHVVAAQSGAPSRLAPVLECDTSENPFMRELLLEPPELRDGRYVVPDAPGLGVEIDETALKRYAV